MYCIEAFTANNFTVILYSTTVQLYYTTNSYTFTVKYMANKTVPQVKWDTAQEFQESTCQVKQNWQQLVD